MLLPPPPPIPGPATRLWLEARRGAQSRLGGQAGAHPSGAAREGVGSRRGGRAHVGPEGGREAGDRALLQTGGPSTSPQQEREGTSPSRPLPRSRLSRQ